MRYALRRRTRRPDLNDAEYAELQAIKSRGKRGMCTNEDLDRWATLEPYRANFTLHHGMKATHRVDCQLPGIVYGCGPRMPNASKAQELADWLCYMHAQATARKRRT